jgi:phytoene/squalene synthetase
MKELYDQVSLDCSKLVTNRYSTSFSLGIRVFDKRFRPPIYAIYGFVRLADEIVDTFHNYNKAELIERFRSDTFQAIDEGISLNPVLHAFQAVVRRYDIESELIHAFLDSMIMDLEYVVHDRASYDRYIYGSAEVVGLMCLRVFTEGDNHRYNELKESARKLGAAFQKVNFLRDMRSDFHDRGRIYFPAVEYHTFGLTDKAEIENEIEDDFSAALAGICQLPRGTKLGVYLAYQYYLRLLKRIKKCSAEQVLKERIRVPDYYKLLLLGKSAIKHQFGLIRV